MSQPANNAREEGKDIPDFFLNLLLSGWLLLFGVRSLIVTPLVWNGTITAVQLASLDPILLKIYLILFSLTLLVAALRAVRQIERKLRYRTLP